MCVNPEPIGVIKNRLIVASDYACLHLLSSFIQAWKPKLEQISERGSSIVVQVVYVRYSYIFVLFIFHLNITIFILFKIGGTKCGKMKYNRRRKVEGYWVLGIVDTETNDYRTSVVKNWETRKLERLRSQKTTTTNTVSIASKQNIQQLSLTTRNCRTRANTKCTKRIEL